MLMVAAVGRDLDFRSKGRKIVERSGETKQRARAVARRSRGRSEIVGEMEAAMDEIALGAKYRLCERKRGDFGVIGFSELPLCSFQIG